MSPAESSSTGLGYATRTCKQKLLKIFFTSYKRETSMPLHSARSLPEPQTLPNHKIVSHQKWKQPTLLFFLTPQSSPSLATPSAPRKPHIISQVSPGGPYNLLADFSLMISPTPVGRTSVSLRQNLLLSLNRLKNSLPTANPPVIQAFSRTSHPRHSKSTSSIYS